MSAPATNVEKQERRHKVPLMGLKGVVVIAALLLIGLVFYAVLQSDDRETDTLIEHTPTVGVIVDP
tara:strand:- start:2443 stop:2640 length:198 start_codon:yes stop_codon:yes gene_type:complete